MPKPILVHAGEIVEEPLKSLHDFNVAAEPRIDRVGQRRRAPVEFAPDPALLRGAREHEKDDGKRERADQGHGNGDPPAPPARARLGHPQGEQGSRDQDPDRVAYPPREPTEREPRPGDAAPKNEAAHPHGGVHEAADRAAQEQELADILLVVQRDGQPQGPSHKPGAHDGLERRARPDARRQRHGLEGPGAVEGCPHVDEKGSEHDAWPHAVAPVKDSGEGDAGGRPGGGRVARRDRQEERKLPCQKIGSS